MSDSKNSLFSRSTARILDIISEGPIGGLVGSDVRASLVLDDTTPLIDPLGNKNFDGIKITQRTGTANQTLIPGFRSVENEVVVGVKLEFGSPIVRAVIDPDLDAVVVKIRIPQLFLSAKDNGDMRPTKVSYRIEISSNGGAYSNAIADVIVDGKSTSAYERSHRIELPSGGNPWSIRLKRLTPPPKNKFTVNDLYISSYTEIYDLKLNYPNTALVGITLDAEEFGSRIPKRSYCVDGIICRVPSNYNPVTRVYTGVWDGTFVSAVTNNPAWILYEIMTNKRWGLGKLFKYALPDKFGLYTIGKYCDVMIKNGNGIDEPRYTFNGTIATREDAIRVLDMIASTFRGMIYYGAGTILFAQDAPATATQLVTPANTIDGFKYGGPSLSSLVTSLKVSYNNPDEYGKIAYIVVTRDDLVRKYGFHQKDLKAYGCTSEAQARRMGEWVLDTQISEGEIVFYKASFDHVKVRPGSIISIADPTYAGARFGGRISLYVPGTTTVYIDAPVTLASGETYSIAVVLPDGTIESKNITTGAGSTAVLTITSAFSQTPVENAMFIITGSDIAPRKFRVVTAIEKAKNEIEVTATFYDPTKYARIERDKIISPPDYSRLYTGKLKQPEELAYKQFAKKTGAKFPARAVHLSWASPNDPRVTQYELQIQDSNDGNWRKPVQLTGNSYDDFPVVRGAYKFRVRSTAPFAKPSLWVTKSFTIKGANPLGIIQWNFENAELLTETDLDQSRELQLVSNGNKTRLKWPVINDPDVTYFQVRFHPSVTATANMWDNAIKIIDYITPDRNSIEVFTSIGTYFVRAFDEDGNSSHNALTAVSGAVVEPNATRVVKTIDDTGISWTLGNQNQNFYNDAYTTQMQELFTAVNLTVAPDADALWYLEDYSQGSTLTEINTGTNIPHHIYRDETVTPSSVYGIELDMPAHNWLGAEKRAIAVIVENRTPVGTASYHVCYYDDSAKLVNEYLVNGSNALDYFVVMPANDSKFAVDGSVRYFDKTPNNVNRISMRVKAPSTCSTIRVYIAVVPINTGVITPTPSGVSILTTGFTGGGFKTQIAGYRFFDRQVNATAFGTSLQLTLASVDPMIDTWATLTSISRIGGFYVTQGYYYFYEMFHSRYTVDQPFNVKLNYNNSVVGDSPLLSDAIFDTLEAVTLLSGDVAGMEIIPLIRVKNSAGWSDWRPFVNGQYIGQHLDFALKITSPRNTSTVLISAFSFDIGIDEQFESHQGDICSSTAQVFEFTNKYHFRPTLTIMPRDMQTGDYYVLDETFPPLTEDYLAYFMISFYNASNTPVTRSFDWTAKG